MPALADLNSRCSSTGSNPPWLHGLQRSNRQPARTSPRSMPNLLDRLHGVFRARRVVLAALSEGRREKPLVHPDRRRPATCAAPCISALDLPRAGRRDPRHARVDQLAQRAADPGQTLALGQTRRVAARHDDHVGSRRQTLALLRESFAQKPLDPIALDRAADLARDRQAQPRRPRRRRAETRTAPTRGPRASGRGGRPGRSRRCATAAPAPAATERPRPGGRRIRPSAACGPCRGGA